MILTERVLPALPADLEWHFLLHDMFVGERAGARLLQHMADEARGEGALARMLLRQADDERAHAAAYAALLGDDLHRVPRYEAALESLVAELPSLTLRIFVLQALIEGLSMGALEYRQRVAVDAPSRDTDERVRADELRHVRFAWGYMADLVARDGVVDAATFDAVTEKVYALFEDSFRPERLDAVVRQVYGQAGDVAAGPARGRRLLWRLTSRAVLHNRAAFLARYQRAVDGRGRDPQ